MQFKAIDPLETPPRGLASEWLTRHGLRLYGGCESVKRATQILSWRVSTASLLSRQGMLEVPTGPAAQRPLLDAGYAVGLLTVAILSGYGVLAPDRLGLATASEPPARIVASIGPRATDPGQAPAEPDVALAKPDMVTPSAPRRAAPPKPLEMARLTPDAPPD